MTRAIVVVLVMAVVLAGCAGPDGEGEEPTVDPDAPNETITDDDYGAEPVNPPNGTVTTQGVETTDGEPTSNETDAGNDT